MSKFYNFTIFLCVGKLFLLKRYEINHCFLVLPSVLRQQCIWWCLKTKSTAKSKNTLLRETSKQANKHNKNINHVNKYNFCSSDLYHDWIFNLKRCLKKWERATQVVVRIDWTRSALQSSQRLQVMINWCRCHNFTFFQDYTLYIQQENAIPLGHL